MMLPYEKCPVCGGEAVERDVEKLIRGGIHMAVMTVRADVCLRCGQRLYSPNTIKLFQGVRRKLEREEIAQFQPLGRSFKFCSRYSHDI